MGVARLLVALHPRKWRESFGDEFAALLEDTPLTPSAVFDVVVHAGRLRVESHRRLVLMLVLLCWSSCLEFISVRTGLTANILWAPTNLERALALAATVGPWLAFAGAAISRRLGGGRGATARTAAP